MGRTRFLFAGNVRGDFIARKVGRQALVAFFAGLAAFMFGNRLLLVLDRVGQSACRVGRFIGVAQIQPQLVGIVNVTFAPVAKPLLHQFVEGQLVFVTLLLELLDRQVLGLQRHVELSQLFALRRVLRRVLLLALLEQLHEFVF